MSDEEMQALKALAAAAKGKASFTKQGRAYIAAASPSAVASLIARCEAAEADAEAAADRARVAASLKDATLHKCDALTAAAEMRGREDAAKIIACGCEAMGGLSCWAPGNCSKRDQAAIASLPPPSGATALAAMLDQARRDALEEAAAVADEFESDADPDAGAALAAAIRARKETRDAE